MKWPDSFLQIQKIERKALFAFLIFLILLIKDVLVADFEVIPIRSRASFIVTYLFSLPLLVIGFILSFMVFFDQVTQGWNKLCGLNMFICLPIIAYCLYLFFGIVYFIFISM